MHHTTDKIPNNQEINKKYDWQKKHLENQTGTKNSFRPVKIRKKRFKKKNMKLGSKIYFFSILVLIF